MKMIDILLDKNIKIKILNHKVIQLSFKKLSKKTGTF